jgi:hypothetical protein
MMLVTIFLLIGVILGLRFKVFILVPAIVLALSVVTVNGVAVQEGAWQLVGTMALVATFLQLGFVGGSILRHITSRTRAADHGMTSVAASTEVPSSGRQLRNFTGSSNRFEAGKQLRQV